MAKQAREAIGTRSLTVLADRGYFEGYEILKCERRRHRSARAQAADLEQQGRGPLRQARLHLRRRRATSTAARPGSIAIRRFTTVEDGKTLHKYWTSACPKCPIKAQCTTGDYRRITRWEHEDVLEAVQAAAGRHARGGATAPANGRARVRHAQGLDGLDALPDEDAAASANRDELARPGLQPEAGDADHGRPPTDRRRSAPLDRADFRPLLA